MSKTKKSYEKPTLKVWGKVADLTKVGNTYPSTDTKSGSVFPPGLGG